jgi:hypothetical protein
MGTIVYPMGLHPLHSWDTISVTVILSGHPITPLYDVLLCGYAVGWNTSFRTVLLYLSHQFGIILLL